MHEVVAERERRLGSSTSHLSRPINRRFEDLVRDMERTTMRLLSSDPLVNIDGSVYIRHSSLDEVDEFLREDLSRHAQWFDSNPDVNSADHTHRWILDYIRQRDAFLRLHHYTCADCGRQIQASIAGG